MSPGKKRNLLILDPDLHSAQRIEDLANGFPGFRPRSYTDYDLASLLIRQLKPQVIVFDITTPGLDVVSFLDDILANESYVPYLVAVAPDGAKDLAAKVLSRSPDFFISKEQAADSLPGILRMILRHESTHDQLLRHDEELQAILFTQKEMICRFLPDTTLTYVNRAYAEMFGKEPEELLGRRFLELVPREDHEEIKSFLSGYSPERSIRTYRHRVHLPDGSAGWQEWTDYAFFDKHGQVSAFQSVGRDVTEEVLLKESLSKTELREREHISHELHDHVGQMLVAVKLRLEDYLMQPDKRKDRKKIREIMDILVTTMEEVRAVSRRMVTGFLKGQSFEKALEELLDSFQTSGRLRINVCSDLMPDNLNHEAQLTLYRILQEALVNVIRHSGASESRITLFLRGGELRLTVRDNGKGVHLPHLVAGYGLRSIRFRVEQMQGRLDFSSKLGRFFKLSVFLPEERVLQTETSEE